MEREYREIETPIGKLKLKLKSWLTAGEKIELTNTGKQIDSIARFGMKCIVVEGPSYEEVMAWHGRDFDFLIEEFTKVLEDSSSPKAPASSADTTS